MRKGSLYFILTALMIAVLVVASCGGGTKTTTSTTTTAGTTTTASSTTSSSTTTSTTTGTTSSTTTTSSTGGGLPTAATAITTHTEAVLTNYKGLCLMCHGAGMTNQFPTSPSWDGKKNGSTVNTDVYNIVAGLPADHTGRTADMCTTQSGCHTAGAAVAMVTIYVTTAGTSLPPKGTVVAFQDPHPGVNPPFIAPHAIDGVYANCITCHMGDNAAGSQFVISTDHWCEECHKTVPEPSFDPAHNGTGFPTLPAQQSCIICHKGTN
jgi:hypothetical protein